MRVLVTTTHRNIVGGVETYLRAILPRLVERGGTVGVLTAYPLVDAQPTILDGCSDVQTWTASNSQEVLRVAAEFRPDVVYTHDLPDPTMDDTLARHFPAVRFVHNYAGSCVSGTKCYAAPNWQPCTRRFGVNCLVQYLPRRCGGLNPLTAVRLYQRSRTRQQTLHRWQAILVASHHMANELIRNGAPSDRVSVVPLFPPETEPDPTPPTRRPQSGRVLFVGRLTALKGWRELLLAVSLASAKLRRRLTLTLAGDGPDREECEVQARVRGVQTEFLGWLDRNAVIAAMRTADVLAVPSVWPEPFGLVGLEAGCVGLPAVAFATGGVTDWLIPGQTGELAPGERPNADQLADALCRALGDTHHHHRLQVGAWQAANRFTVEVHIDQLVSLLWAARQ